jgi:branched-chain amino acid transport system ATP-binding protein
MLEVRDLAAGYGRLQVLVGMKLSVRAGETVGILGPNGAGKTTLVETLAGLVRATRGSISLEGVDVSRKPAYERARRGLRLVPTGRALFGPLSVERNLKLGSLLHRESNGTSLEQIFEIFPILAEKRKHKASTLSGGQQQMLAIGRALIGNPKILILDEPSLGLAPVVTEQLYEALGSLKSSGQTILIVEEKIDYVLDFADRYLVVNGGRIVLEGATSEVTDHAQLSVSYLG